MKLPRLLITGASGFVGSHLLEYLHKRANFEVFGTIFGDDNNINDWLDEKHQLQLNLLDREETATLVERVTPDYVIHLAALSSPSRSMDDSRRTYENNISAQLNLLDALKHTQNLNKVLIIGSADEYGMVDGQVDKIDENIPLRPLNPYSVSKITQDYMGLQYHLSFGMPIVRLRPFNHTGERRHEAFVTSSFAKQIAEIEKSGQDGEILVGNLSPIRDFTDVKDMVAGYVLALQHCVPGEVYNIGSGKGVSIQSVLDMLIGYSSVKIATEVDQQKVRKMEVSQMICDATKFKDLTGWDTTIPLENTLLRVLNYWRSK